MKKIILTTLLILIFILTIGITQTLAADPTYEEAVELIENIPDEFDLDLKESEFLKATSVVENKLKDMLGIEDITVDCYNYLMSWLEEVEDIKKLLVTIGANQSGKKVYLEKEITVNYTNSAEWNEQHSEYVINSIEGKNFNISGKYEINSDGTKGEYENKKDFTWNELIGTNEIEIQEVITHDYINLFDETLIYKLFLFKNDILYKIVDAREDYISKITIPENIEETDEAYIEYAKPIIEKFLNNSNSVGKYKYEYKINEINRTYEDFIQFRVGEVEAKQYINNEYIKTETYEEDAKLLIAKAGEYRSKLVPILQELELVQANNCIRGNIEIKESIMGEEKSMTDLKYLPEIVLVDENNNEYKTEITKGENDTYYFEINLSDLRLEKNYKIQARNTSPNNKYPENNINSTLKAGINIYVLNDNIAIKSILTDSIVQLSIKKISAYKIGDISGDEKINTKDARFVLLNYVGKEDIAEVQKEAADVNKDGKINTKDARQILLYYVGRIDEF